MNLGKGDQRKPIYFLWVVPFILGIFFRFYGLNWDNGQFLHPDERFLVQVADSIHFPASISLWFNAAESSFNPSNSGFHFYVYGTFPLVLIKAIQGFLGHYTDPASYSFLLLTGRFLSAFFDFLTLLCICRFSRNLWKSRKAAFLSVCGYGFFVGAIQQAHFFTVDSFCTFFCTFSLLSVLGDRKKHFYSQAIVSGIALGIALACKISAIFFILFPALDMVFRTVRRHSDIKKELFRFFLMISASAFAFRIFQPYAFQNPQFFDFRLNSSWIAAMRELAEQSSGRVDFPPAWQWVGRSPFYALKNLLIYGMGLLPGGLVFAGFVLSIRQGFKKDNYVILTLIIGTAVFFLAQTAQFSKMMRYLYPICPILFLLLGSLLEVEGKVWMKIFLSTALACAFLRSCAFLSIYQRPHTRVQASRWVYDQIPAAISVQVSGETDEVEPDLQVAVPTIFSVETGDDPIQIPLAVQKGDIPRLIEFENLKVNGENCSIRASINSTEENRGLILTGDLIPNESQILFAGDDAILGNQSFLSLQTVGNGCSAEISGDSFLYFLRNGKPRYLLLKGLAAAWITDDKPLEVHFKIQDDGSIAGLSFHSMMFSGGMDQSVPISFTFINYNNSTEKTENFSIISSANQPVAFSLSDPIKVKAGEMIGLRIAVNSKRAISVQPKRIATESSWDDRLPLRMEGQIPYDPTYGRYGTVLDLDLFSSEEVLWKEKLIAKIDAADFLIIGSARGYGMADRAEKKFPILNSFYRQLVSCPDGDPLTDCFNKLSVKSAKENPYFKPVAVFQSEPTLFGHSLSTQSAEEAFTVYDHPKVFIFQKQPQFSLSEFRKRLDFVNLSDISDKTPVEYKNMEQTYALLTESQAILQQSGGTWSELFNRSSLINSNPILTVILWYLLILGIGLIFFPLSHMIFGSFRDKGYGISRFFGLLIFGYAVWVLCFSILPYTKKTILSVFLVLAGVNLLIFLFNRKSILRDLYENRRYIFQSEIVFLSCFVFFLLIRLGNPDLWHPYKGGEKPMDFSYFNAVIKSTSFPPYDPWFAGGSMNYYYYGFFLSGLLVKWIGLIPSVAYNLILPTWYAFLGVGAFTLGSNLYAHRHFGNTEFNVEKGALKTGILSVLLLQVFGNLGTLKVIAVELTELGCAGINEASTAFEKIGCFFNGIGKILQGQHFQMYAGDWYWIPSRAIPGEPITEFPFFTFLYGDPHAHLFALPITVMVLVWLTSLIVRRKTSGNGFNLLSLASGALIIGSLIPTNTWDMPTYLLLSCIVLLDLGVQQPLFQFNKPSSQTDPSLRKFSDQKIISSILSVVILCGLSFILFKPYLDTNTRESAIDVWNGSRTPVWSYLMHWGLFLFALISWYYTETIDWLARVKVSDFRNFIQKQKNVLITVAVFFVGIMVAFSAIKVWVAWIAVPLMFWTLCLLMRRDTPISQRFLLFLAGTALFITLFVEFFCLRGDIGRMNMVFKLYLQAWVLFTPVSAFALISVIQRSFEKKTESEKSRKKVIWRFAYGFLLIGAFSYTIFASVDKIKDRMSTVAPHTLDGMEFMKTSFYFQDGFLMDLSQDYDAIRWMQDNVKGSPVIVEANATEYKWGNRFTVYTGLPGVVGWNYHQRQQRGNMSDQVWERVNAITSFYNDSSLENAVDFLKRYNVRYIIVGQMERGMYAPEGIEKFIAGNGIYWDCVYLSKDTAIYRVKEQEAK